MSTKNFEIDTDLEIGLTTLNVKDLKGMVRYYEDVIGLSVVDEDYGSMTLGIAATKRPLLRLINKRDGQAYPQSPGLFHIAFLLPTRADLGHWLRHFAQTRQLDGAGDHLVSEALYLTDPEGNGIEIYWDRPRSEWTTDTDGKIQMDTLRVDFGSLIAEAPTAPFTKLPAGTVMGHIHLQVDDVNNAQAFYHSVLGFETAAFISNQAGFFGAGGYHHHIGANVWKSRGAGPRPADALGLDRFELIFSSQQKLDEVVEQLKSADVPYDQIGRAIEVIDPAGNKIILKT